MEEGAGKFRHGVPLNSISILRISLEGESSFEFIVHLLMSERQTAFFVRKVQLLSQDAGYILNTVVDWRVLGPILHTTLRRRALFVRELNQRH